MRAPRPVIYQLVVRLFGNTNETQKLDGTIEENGVGKLADVDDRALASLRALGVTHLWLTGVLRHATLTDYAALGMPADPPGVVKGRAGSFYAVRDAFDVCPDLAIDPARRLEELRELVARAHAHDLRVLVDLVPNHVSRAYASVRRPDLDFGVGDDQTKFFSPDNDFFYLVDPPGQVLELPVPSHWHPDGVVFSRAFEREAGGPGRVPRATGNDVTSPRPGETDWYETVKLNYGYDFVSKKLVTTPEPKVWHKIDAVLAFWQSQGVDGFRCDFAHWVPAEAWRHLLARTRERDPGVLLIGEAYEAHDALFDAGFDALYDFETYNLAKAIYQGRASARDLAARLEGKPERTRDRHVAYLENHDEKRVAAPIVPGAASGESGFGSADAARQLAPLLFLHGRGPVLVHNGQEVGEEGRVRLGFGGGDGRTSIFDYGSIPALVAWVNDRAFDGGGLDEPRRRLRAYYADLLALCQDRAVRTGDTVALGTDREWDVVAYARTSPEERRLLVVAASFAPGARVRARIAVDAASLARVGIGPGDRCLVERIFDERGRTDEPARELDAADVARGIEIDLGDQAAAVVVVMRA